MAPYPARERRHTVWLGARMLSRRGWSDLTIGDVSPRGIMGMCKDPPERGEYIEVRCGTYVVVACVAWSEPDRFGAMSLNRIELADLLSGSIGRQLSGDRRKLPRPDKEIRQRLPATARVAGTVGAICSLEKLRVIALAGLLAGFSVVYLYNAIARPKGEAVMALHENRVADAD